MLNLESDLSPMVNLAVDVIGLATRYDFTVMRWGTHIGASCCVGATYSDQHDKWVAVDVEFSDEDKIPAFITDCVIAGLHCFRRGSFVHVTNEPFYLPPVADGVA